MINTKRFSQALALATELHATQVRKGGLQSPFICHPLAVASLVIENGGTEDEAIAGLLHDAVEDQGGLETYNLILKTFGDNVASIVNGCTDAWETPKPPWKERKEQHIEHLKQESLSVLLVYACDKIHNLRCLVVEYRQYGEDIWKTYKGGKEGTMWYFTSLVEVFQERLGGTVVTVLASVLDELNALILNNKR